MSNKFRNSIAYRLLFVVLLFSLAITLISAGVGLYFDYRDKISSLEKGFSEVEKVQLKSLTESLWVMDTEQLHVQLQGFLNIGHIKYVKIQYKEEMIVSAGATPQTEQVVHRQFPLYYTYDNRQQYIGTLFVTASLKEVYEGLLGDMASRLLYQGIQVFLITLFMFVIFQGFVTRHLITMAAYFRKEDPWASDKPLVLAGYTSTKAEKDEIGQVAAAINTMSTNMRNAFNELETELQKRRRAEEQIRENEDFLNTIIENIPDMIFVKDADDLRFVRFNRAGEELLGYSRDAMLGKNDYDLFPKDAADLFTGKDMAVLKSGRLLDIPEESILTKNKGERVLHTKKIPVSDRDGRPQYLLGISEDITDRKQAEIELQRHQNHLEELVKTRTAELEAANVKLQELDRMKSMFIASMSHELRTPLNSIIGFSGMILEGMAGDINPEIKDYIRRVNRSGMHLLAMITDVIDISKLESGMITVVPEDFQLDILVREAIDNLTVQVKSKGLTIKSRVPEGLKMYTDRRSLLQCILNLLSNAVKFTDRGKVNIIAKEYNNTVDISVSDTGIGIAKEDIEKIYEPFERLESHLKIKAGGTGLGLYLTSKLAKDVLHGNVETESELGKGSTFRLKVPKEVKP